MRKHIREAMEKAVMQRPGAFVLVDGQYGSTGKGLAAAVLAEHAGHMFDAVTSNAGPNSGHTSYINGRKVVLCQLPTFGVACENYGYPIPMYMNAGAVIAPEKLKGEIMDYVADRSLVRIHPHAAVVSSGAVLQETDLKDAVGSTGKGTGAALADKIMRKQGAVAQNAMPGFRFGHRPDPQDSRVFVEVSQGFSLSLNAGGFYPYCTSRDCTVAQALSDACMHPYDFMGAMMVLRTFPIRVGGNSGPGYSDQKEITWEELGVEPEITTVTKKVRRVFTWSDLQYIEALMTNRPSMLFFNFMNYLPRDKQGQFVVDKVQIYHQTMGTEPDLVLLGYGPKNEDVVPFYA